MEDRGVRRLSAEERDQLLNDFMLLQPLPEKAVAGPAKAQPEPADDAFVLLEANQNFLSNETILELSVEAPTTQVGYEREPRAQQEEPTGEDPLEDKNFKVFLRLLTSV